MSIVTGLDNKDAAALHTFPGAGEISHERLSVDARSVIEAGRGILPEPAKRPHL
jgi:hypothetical protein